MNSAKMVDSMIVAWKNQQKTKSEMVRLIAEACMGWPYVYGAAGAECTPNTRRSYAKNYQTRKPDEAAVILSKCQVCRESNPKSSCSGCKWYPHESSTRCFDCRGFTRWVFGKTGITINGAGCTSQWNDDNNWEVKGSIKEMPSDQVCCVFMNSGNTMSHTGIYLGDGRIIHCSGEVKEGRPTDRGWTHYAVPKGMDGKVSKPTIRKGSTGPFVVECQQDLITLKYDLSPYGADGKFGAKTEAAVKSFQKSVGLPADGIVGPKTWDALDEAVKPIPGDLYTVIIPHLTEDQANVLQKQYPDAEKRREG